jgi:hypothetical protein
MFYAPDGSFSVDLESGATSVEMEMFRVWDGISLLANVVRGGGVTIWWLDLPSTLAKSEAVHDRCEIAGRGSDSQVALSTTVDGHQATTCIYVVNAKNTRFEEVILLRGTRMFVIQGQTQSISEIDRFHRIVDSFRFS